MILGNIGKKADTFLQKRLKVCADREKRYASPARASKRHVSNKCRKGITISGGCLAFIADQYAMCYYCATGKPRPSESEKPSATHFSGNSCHVDFMSGDQDENAYNAYYASMPWMS